MKTIYDFLADYGLTKTLLNSISIESKLGIPLSRDLNHFIKKDVIKELRRITSFYISLKRLGSKKYDYRIKSISSINRKFDKYYMEGRNFKKVFNDIIGFRLICTSYKDILNLKLDKNSFKLIDMSKGKKNDDGYRGIHLYYQKNSKCYPIEIQIFLEKDRNLNGWLHEYVYKRNIDFAIGKKLKILSDNGKINNEIEFKEALDDVLCISKKV